MILIQCHFIVDEERESYKRAIIGSPGKCHLMAQLGSLVHFRGSGSPFSVEAPRGFGDLGRMAIYCQGSEEH